MSAGRKQLEKERQRERRRQQNEIEQIMHIHLQEKLQQISQTRRGQKILAYQIADREAKELQKERRELQAKLMKSQGEKVDYFERAKRLEEIPLLQERQLQDQNFWEQQEKERIAAAIEERKLAVATRDRFSRIKPEKDEFLAKLKKERNTVYEEKLQAFESRLAEERTKRRAERKAIRKEDRRTKWLKEKQEEEKRKLEEQRLREEEEKLALEEKGREQKLERERIEKDVKEHEARENQEMLDRTAAKQKAREGEIAAQESKPPAEAEE